MVCGYEMRLRVDGQACYGGEAQSHVYEYTASVSADACRDAYEQGVLAELYRVVDKGMRDIEQGRVRDARDASRELRERYWH